MSVFEHPDFDNHEHVAFHQDQKTGLSAIIAVHNTNLGPSLGGCRMWTYESSLAALTDVLRLSKGMTYKSALANLKLGGGKSVIIGNSRTQKTPELMQAMGAFIDTLAGKYISAEDSGIAVADIKEMRKNTEHVSGYSKTTTYDGLESNGNPAPQTAYGVFVGLQASVKYKLKTDLKGVRVAIQGLGHVGYRLAEMLHRAGAELYVADIFPESLKRAEAELNATVVKPEDIFGLDVEVFAPCALGGAINADSIEQLKAKVIAGAANNQLAERRFGEELMQRGILYAPDYVINAGGIIDIYHQRIDSDHHAMREHIEGIDDTLVEIYRRSEQQNQPCNLIANQIAEEKFAR